MTAIKPKKTPIDPANLSTSAKNRNKGPSNRPSTTSEIDTSAFQVRRRPVSRKCRRRLNAENARPLENKRPAPSKTYNSSTARAYFHLGGLEYVILHGTSVLSASFLTSDRRTTRAYFELGAQDSFKTYSCTTRACSQLGYFVTDRRTTRACFKLDVQDVFATDRRTTRACWKMVVHVSLKSWL